jgi:DNA-binding NarL/FixJ family response regulator
MKRPRVLLADDHPILTEGIERILEPRFELIGAVQDGRALVREAEWLDPDIVLVDISMPLLNGIDAARQLKKIEPRCKIVFLSMHADPDYVSEAFAAGASGYLLKSSFSSELVFALEEVLKGRYYVAPAVAKDVVEAFASGPGDASRKGPPQPASKLTPRQREVLQLVAEGKSVKEIACVLDVSVKTVEFHKTRIMEQLDLHSTAELTKYAVAHGLASL